MKHRWILGVGLAIVIVPSGWIALNRVRAKAALEEQYRLARSEGIPTTAAEYAATLPPAKPEENAGPIYREMKSLPGARTDAQKLELRLFQAPGPATIQAAEAHLKSTQEQLALLDRAVALPRCWFDRKWEDGAAVLMPEFAYMKGGSGLFALRGSVAATCGDHRTAIAEAEKMQKIAIQAGEEGHAISQAVQTTIHLSALRHLAVWASFHPDRPEYRQAMEKAIRALPNEDPKRAHAADLYNLMSTVELSVTPEGRARLGFRQEDIPATEQIASVFMNRSQARVDLVKAERELWAAYTAETLDAGRVGRATHDLGRALIAFPTAYSLYIDLDMGGSPSDLRNREAFRLHYTALLRALGPNGIARTIKTSDLKSPFDGKPLTYRFDGQDVTITISGLTDPMIIPVRDGKHLLLGQ